MMDHPPSTPGANGFSLLVTDAAKHETILPSAPGALRRWGCLQIKSFVPRASNPALFTKGVYFNGTGPEQKEPGDTVIGQKTY